MKAIPCLLLAALALPPAANAQTQTSDTRLGKLTFTNGYPSEETARKLYDEMDYQRAVQAYLWAYPAVSFESIRVGLKRDLGADYNDMVIGDNFVDTRSVWLTANDTTIYGVVNLNLTEPLVIENPPGAIVGLLADFWQRAVTDVGLSGPDAGKGGKFLLLPAGYQGEVPAQGYHVVRATMTNHNFMVRGFVVDNDVAGAVQRMKQIRIYPLAERDRAGPLKTLSMSGKELNTLAPDGIEYWRRLAAVVNNNPVHERDRFFMAMLKPLGIEKGKPFQPDARQQAILVDAATVGEATARTLLFDAESRFNMARAFPDTQWNWVVLMNPDQESPHYSQLDERLHYYYGAIYMSPAIGRKTAGPGATYVQAFKDKEGKRLEGGKSYRLRVPANVPVSNFWSMTLYDTATRSMIRNPRNDAALSSYDKLKANADGSVDLHFGPAAPAGLESNWIETISGKGYYAFFRFYGPTETLFAGAWRMPDLEMVK